MDSLDISDLPRSGICTEVVEDCEDCGFQEARQSGLYESKSLPMDFSAACDQQRVGSDHSHEAIVPCREVLFATYQPRQGAITKRYKVDDLRVLFY